MDSSSFAFNLSNSFHPQERIDMESEDSGRREVINNAVTWVIVILVAAIRLT